MNDYFTFFYVKHFELPMCMKCAIQINLPCLALPNCIALLAMEGQKALGFHQKYFNCVPKMNKCLMDMEQHEGE